MMQTTQDFVDVQLHLLLRFAYYGGGGDGDIWRWRIYEGEVEKGVYRIPRQNKQLDDIWS